MAHFWFSVLCGVVADAEMGTFGMCLFLFCGVEQMDEFAGLTEEEIERVQRCLWLEFDCRDSWIKAIQFSPKLAAYCNCWHNFTTMDWARLLSDNIQFINMAPLHKMTFAEWVVVLNKQPSLIDHCPISDEMPDFVWSKIQQKYPPRKRKTKADNCK